MVPVPTLQELSASLAIPVPPKVLPRALQVQVGSRVRIRDEGLIHPKLRHYSLSEAEIIEVPMHPNTWYGVRLADGRRIKIRKSAFDLLDERGLPILLPSPSISAANSPANPARLTSPPKAIFSPNQGITLGARVTIVSNNDVMQKFPKLVGCVGEIIDIPRHPNTWFTVRLADSGRIVKFRRSALQFDFEKEYGLYEDDGFAELRNEGISNEDSFEMDIDDSLTMTEEAEGAGVSLLQCTEEFSPDSDDLSYDQWVGREVRIRQGRFSGFVGRVASYSNEHFRISFGSEEIIKERDQVSLLKQRRSSLARQSNVIEVQYPVSNPAKKMRRDRIPKKVVGNFVRIENGKFMGQIGCVTKVRNNCCIIEVWGEKGEIETPMVIMKNINDFTILGRVPPEGFENSNLKSFALDADMEFQKNLVGKQASLASGSNRGESGVIVQCSPDGRFVVRCADQEVRVTSDELNLVLPSRDSEEGVAWEAASILNEMMSSSMPPKPLRQPKSPLSSNGRKESKFYTSISSLGAPGTKVARDPAPHNA